MEGLAKSSQTTQPTQVQPAKTETPILKQTESIPMEMYRYFQINPAISSKETTKELKTIYNWARKKDSSLGEAFMKMRNLAVKLGYSGTDKMHTKMYNWIRVSNIVDELSDERESQIARKIKKHENKAKQIKQQLESQLKGIEKTKEKERSELKKMHAKEIAQLKKLKAAYEYGGR